MRWLALLWLTGVKFSGTHITGFCSCVPHLHVFYAVVCRASVRQRREGTETVSGHGSKALGCQVVNKCGWITRKIFTFSHVWLFLRERRKPEKAIASPSKDSPGQCGNMLKSYTFFVAPTNTSHSSHKQPTPVIVRGKTNSCRKQLPRKTLGQFLRHSQTIAQLLSSMTYSCSIVSTWNWVPLYLTFPSWE